MKLSRMKVPAEASGPTEPEEDRRGSGERASGVRKRIKSMRPGEILDAAFEEFVRHGYAATRLDDVARRVGLTKGALYLYFPSKVELFKAVVRSCVQPILADVEQKLASFQGSTPDLLVALLDSAYDHVLNHRREREIMRLLMVEGVRYPELTDFYFTEVVARSLSLLDQVIGRGLASGEFRRSAVTEMPLVLFSSCVHASCWQLLFGDRHPLDVDKLKHAHLAVVLASLTPNRSDLPLA
jgi:AcrR family transcriptional regulator